MRISEHSCLPLRWSTSAIALAILLVVMLSETEHTLAIDPPHNGKNSLNMTISCTSCHFDTSGPTPSWATRPTTTDETFFNNLCTSCHMPSQMTDSRYVVKTHSSSNTSGKYGTWTIECRRCHNPHVQDQVSSYPTDPTADLATGSVVSYAQVPVASQFSTMYVTAGLMPNAWTDHILVPNIAYPTKMYHIRSNANNSITVSGAIDGRYAKPGNTYVIRYGKMVRSEIGLPSSGVRAVKFFGASGMNSFGTSTDPANMTSICQVCHVQTASFNNSGVLEGPGHPSLQAGGDCIQCHTHASGFKPECSSCHGNPPLLNVLGGPDGLALNDGGTGPTAPGAHGTHAVSLQHACTTCHSGGMPTSPIYDKVIQIGFNLFGGAYQNGSYDGRTLPLANGYGYAPGNAGTSISNSGTMNCGNLYCHGNYSGSGLNAMPTWGNAATGACGTCHGASNTTPPVSGSHKRHASSGMTGARFNREYACTLCHKDTVGGTGPFNYTIVDKNKHVNGYVDWTFDANDLRTSALSLYSIASGTAVPSNGTTPRAYGACSKVFCHSTVQPNGGSGAPTSYDTIQWGGTVNCYLKCHAGADLTYMHGTDIATGSHSQHMAYILNSYKINRCTLCHKWNSTAAGVFDGTTCSNQCHSSYDEKNLHADGSVEVTFDTYFGNGIYNGTPAPGDGYGNCSNTYCHSNGTSVSSGAVPANSTPHWGAGALACTSCHGYPPGYANGIPKANSHAKHEFHSFGCGECHAVTTIDGTSIASRTSHVNKAYDVDAAAARTFIYTFAAGGGTCSTISCHNNGAATWGAFACDSCHDCPPPTGSHVKHFGTAAMYNAVYGDTRIAQDISGTTAVYIMNCGNCHPVDPAKHYNGTVEVELYSAQSPSGSLKSRNETSAEYTAGGTVFTDGRGFPYTQGTCRNVYCHSYNEWTTPGGVPESTDCSSYLPPNLVTARYYRTPTWGSSALTCSGCHGIAPRTDYPANDGGSGDSHFWVDGYGYGNLHNWNMGYAPISCSFCHNETIRTQNTWTRDAMDVATQSDVPIYNYAKHVNGSTDVAFDRVNTFPYSTPYSLMGASYSPATKTCSNVSCHQSQTNVNWGTPYRWYYTVECDRCHNFGGTCP